MTLFKKFLVVLLPVLFLVGCSSSSSRDQAQGNTSGSDSNSSYSLSTDGQYQMSVAEQIAQLESMDTVYFGFNQYNVKDDYSQFLDRHASLLLGSPSTVVTIEGHADERGTSEYNIALGERRANAVKSYLQARGVPSKQIMVVSFGKEKPAVLGHTEAIYQKNRRAVLVY